MLSTIAQPPSHPAPLNLRSSPAGLCWGTVNPRTCAQGCVLVTETQAARTGSAQHTKGLGVGGEVSAYDCFRKHFKQHTDKNK